MAAQFFLYWYHCKQPKQQNFKKHQHINPSLIYYFHEWSDKGCLAPHFSPYVSRKKTRQAKRWSPYIPLPPYPQVMMGGATALF